MNHDNALATVDMPSGDQWTAMMAQAETLVQSGFLPSEINTAAKAVAVILTGRELRIPAMQALRQITVIKGKPVVSPELMAALVERDYGSGAMIVTESNDKACVIRCHKPGWPEATYVPFTIEDATRAGLANGDTWRKYPTAMLRSRAISMACKTHFQASIGGMFTAEEMGARVNEDGGYEPLPHEQHIARVEAMTGARGYWPQGEMADEQASREAAMAEDAATVDQDTGEILDHTSPGERELHATPAQIKKIFAAGKEHGWAREELRALMEHEFGKLSTGDLAITEATQMIKIIEGRLMPGESTQPVLVTA